MATSGSGDGGGSGDGNERIPSNLQGLLRFCTEQTKAEDPTTETSRAFAPLSDERRQFLDDVLKSLAARDPIKVMLEDIKIILDSGDSGQTDDEKEKKEQALDDLQMHVEDIDLANDFHKLGGYALFKPLLASSHSGYRWRTADLIATLAQNNPYSQQCLLDSPDLFKSLIDILENDPDKMSRIKAMYAISCLCREFPPAREKFLKEHDGFSVLVRAIQSDIDKIQTKAAFMLAALCTEMPEYIDTLVNMGVSEQLVGMLHQPHSPYHEHLMKALLVLCEHNKRAQEECRRPELDLNRLLKERVALLEGKEQYQEELEYAKKLQQIIFSGLPGEVDR